MADNSFEVRIKRICYEAESINSYELVLPHGGDLPSFTAGSHVDLHLPNGLVRSYSLVNNQREQHRYIIAVNKDIAGRGGSRSVHHEFKAGDLVRVSHPRNNFALREDADISVLIAGGIGITPLLSMVRRLDALGRRWTLFYAARSRAAAAFLDELDSLRSADRSIVNLDFDDVRSGRVFDVAGIVANAPANAHLYCCGPLPMLRAFELATAARPAERVHVEYFQAAQAPSTEGGFDVRLARGQRTIAVKAGTTILDALLEAGVAVNFACTEGVCGTCETRVIDGIPDHRDQFLSPDEQAANTSIMICCSGAKSRTLVLDL